MKIRFPRYRMFRYDIKWFIKDIVTLPLQLICMKTGHKMKKIAGSDFEICLFCGKVEKALQKE